MIKINIDTKEVGRHKHGSVVMTQKAADVHIDVSGDEDDIKYELAALLGAIESDEHFASLWADAIEMHMENPK